MKKSRVKIEPAVTALACNPVWIAGPLALVPLLLVLGYFLPGRTTFGFSQWEVVPVWLWVSASIAYYVILAIALRPVSGAEAGVKSIDPRNRATAFLVWSVVGVGLGVLFFAGRSKSYFYGDGYMVIAGSTAPLFSGISGDEAVKVLTIFVCRFAVTVLGSIAPGRPQIPIAVLNSIGGVVALAALVRLSWILGETKTSRIFLLLTGLTSGCVVLCFGWIEHYTWALAALLWSFYFSITYFQTGSGFWRATVSWCIAAGFALELGPLLLLFFFMADLVKRKKLPSVGRLSLTIALASLIMAGLCYFLAPTLSIVPFFPGGSKPYWALSPDHLLDLLNLTLLVSPLGILLLISGRLSRKTSADSPDGVFLGAGAFMLFMIFFWIDPTLGAPRDWDLLSLFGIPMTLYAARRAIAQVDRRIVRNSLWATGCLVVMLIAPNVYEKSNADLALARLDRWLWEDPHYQVSYRGASRGITWAALVQTSTNHPELADKYLWRRLSVVPEDDITWFNLGEIALGRGQFDSAAVALERAYRAWPEHDVYLVRYAQALQATKDNALRELLPRLKSLTSDEPKVLENAALVLANEGLLTEALSLYHREARLNPSNPRPNLYLALTFHKLRQSDSAVYYFERALLVAAKSERPRIYASLIVEQLAAGRPNEASRTLQEFRRQFPSDTLLPKLQKMIDAPR